MFERWVAHKVWIKDLTEGKWEKEPERESPYLKTKDGRKIVRCRILGTIITKFLSEDGNYAFFAVDDGSDVIRLKMFRDEVKKFENFNKGDVVDVIGRVREYEGETYISPEIIVKVQNPNYEFLRKIELKVMHSMKGS